MTTVASYIRRLSVVTPWSLLDVVASCNTVASSEQYRQLLAYATKISLTSSVHLRFEATILFHAISIDLSIDYQQSLSAN
jgi:hypothetical protein